MADIVENSNGNINERDEREEGLAVKGQIERARQGGKFKLPAIISPRPNFENGGQDGTPGVEGKGLYRGSTPQLFPAVSVSGQSHAFSRKMTESPTVMAGVKSF